MFNFRTITSIPPLAPSIPLPTSSQTQPTPSSPQATPSPPPPPPPATQAPNPDILSPFAAHSALRPSPTSQFPGSPTWASQSTNFGRRLSSTHTTRRPGLFLFSTPSTSMDASSSSRGWASSSRSGHGKSSPPIGMTPQLLTVPQVRVSTSGKIYIISHHRSCDVY